MHPATTRWSTPAQHRRITLGGVEISYIPDGFVELEPTAWYGTTEFEEAPAVNGGGFLVGSVGSVVIHEPDGNVVIDAGLGPAQVPAAMTHRSLGRMMGGMNPDYLPSLDQPIKTLAVTHAHEDHVGWLRGSTGPALNPQEILAGSADVERLARLTGSPLIGALAGGEQISENVFALATPGHTAGHMSYIVESQGERAIIFGDVFHSPAQIHDRSLAPWSDEVPDQAVRSRASVSELLRDPGTIGVGYHFADVVFGRTNSFGKWEPLQQE